MTTGLKSVTAPVDLLNFDSMKETNSSLMESGSTQTLPDPVAKRLHHQKNKSPGNSKNKEEKLPRPPNSWILYRSDKIVEMRSQHNGLAQCLLSKEIATKWHNESPEVKSDYEKKAELVKAEHAIKYPDYKYSPKRRKMNATRKDGQNVLTESAFPLGKSKCKESNTSNGPKSTASRTRKRKAFDPADELSAKEGSKPSIDVDVKPDSNQLGVIDADLSSPLLPQLLSEQKIQSQRSFSTPSVGHSPVDLNFDQRFSQWSYGSLKEHDPLINQQTLHLLPGQELMPAAQPQSEWLDFTQLDPQLQYENSLTLFSGTSTSQWTAPTDLGTPSVPNSSYPVLTSSTNQNQSATPNPIDFGFFAGSDILDFNRVDEDWLNINPQNRFHGVFLGQPLDESSYCPSFGSTHQNLPGTSFLA